MNGFLRFFNFLTFTTVPPFRFPPLGLSAYNIQASRSSPTKKLRRKSYSASNVVHRSQVLVLALV